MWIDVLGWLREVVFVLGGVLIESFLGGIGGWVMNYNGIVVFIKSGGK